MSPSLKSSPTPSLSKTPDSMSFFNHTTHHAYAPAPTASQHDQYSTWDVPAPNRQAQLSSIWRKADSFFPAENTQDTFGDSVYSLPKSLESLVLDDRDDETDAGIFAHDDPSSPAVASSLSGFVGLHGAIGDRGNEFSPPVSDAFGLLLPEEAYMRIQSSSIPV